MSIQLNCRYVHKVPYLKPTLIPAIISHIRLYPEYKFYFYGSKSERPKTC